MCSKASLDAIAAPFKDSQFPYCTQLTPFAANRICTLMCKDVNAPAKVHYTCLGGRWVLDAKTAKYGASGKRTCTRQTRPVGGKQQATCSIPHGRQPTR